MARLKKEEVIKELEKLKVPFDINGKYNDLCKLLKAKSGTVPHGTVMKTIKNANGQITITQTLYDRCRKKIGLDDEQIVSYETETALKKWCNAHHPQSNPDSRPKVASPNVPKVNSDAPDKIEFDSKQEAMFISSNRLSFDEKNLQSELRLYNRRYGSRKPVRIVLDKTFEPERTLVKGRGNIKVFVTHITVHYTKGKEDA